MCCVVVRGFGEQGEGGVRHRGVGGRGGAATCTAIARGRGQRRHRVGYVRAVRGPCPPPGRRKFGVALRRVVLCTWAARRVSLYPLAYQRRLANTTRGSLTPFVSMLQFGAKCVSVCARPRRVTHPPPRRKRIAAVGSAAFLAALPSYCCCSPATAAAPCRASRAPGTSTASSLASRNAHACGQHSRSGAWASWPR